MLITAYCGSIGSKELINHKLEESADEIFHGPVYVWRRTAKRAVRATAATVERSVRNYTKEAHGRKTSLKS